MLPTLTDVTEKGALRGQTFSFCQKSPWIHVQTYHIQRSWWRFRRVRFVPSKTENIGSVDVKSTTLFRKRSKKLVVLWLGKEHLTWRPSPFLQPCRGLLIVEASC